MNFENEKVLNGLKNEVIKFTSNYPLFKEKN
jgi:hypothetical protein